MFRRYLFPSITAALVATGCVPVTAPVGDVEKSEPDKALVGKWATTDSGDTAKLIEVKTITVDTPAVKGNPKGLMRVVVVQSGSVPEFWFFTATVGKHTYINLPLEPSEKNNPLNFAKEGAFAEWKKSENKRFFISQYTCKDGELMMDWGNHATFKTLCEDAKLTTVGESKPLPFFDTPSGWLDKYLDKTGPAKVFDGKNYLKLDRQKK